MRDGKIIEITGHKVLGNEQPGVISTNYTEIYLLLTDFTITRMSMCTDCRIGLGSETLDKCFNIVKKHMIVTSRSAGMWEQAAVWEKLGFISFFNTDQEARAAQKLASGDSAIPLNGHGLRPIGI